MKTKTVFKAEEFIENKIYVLRNQKIMLDFDLANLYEVATKMLNQAVKRNIDRFPEDFMFVLNAQEYGDLISQFVISNYDQRRSIIYAFTEQGIAMLSSVLKSPRAIQVNIQIMRTFTKMRQMLASHAEIKDKILEMEAKYDENFRVVFDAIRMLIEEDEKPKQEIGFKVL